MASENKFNEFDDAIFVALGSNLAGAHASPQALLEAALAALDDVGVKVVERSRWWRSQAWPDPSQPAYINAVARVTSPLAPKDLLAVLHEVEAAFGRHRGAVNAARTLDLDLVAHGRIVLDDPVLPHPRAHERRFVMGPLAELAPGWRHPISGRSAQELNEDATVGLDARVI